MCTRGPLKILIVGLGYLLFTGVLVSWDPIAQSQTCPYNFSSSWPASNPVWTLSWNTPDQSAGIDGSGLQLTNLVYKGRQALHLAHLPVLNVLYQPGGGCGDTNGSHRDWATGMKEFEAANVVSTCRAEPTTSPQTVCDHPGSDAGSFTGVSVEKKPEQLILTTQMQAGWYRYVQKWILFLDGTIQARFYFTAINDYCVTMPHYHQAYWRLDFNIEGAGSDVVEEYGVSKGWTVLLSETSRKKNPTEGLKWRVLNKGTGRGYEIVPETNDDIGDSWAVADLWALRYHDNELDDGGATSGPMGNAAHMNNYINGESIKGKHDVLWYRAGRKHDSLSVCAAIGFELKPVGRW